MRDIKFRAWNHFTDKMVTVSGLSYDQNMKIDEVCILSSSFSWEDAEYLEVMQYTGLNDKNGKEIYEGDIIGTDANDRKAIVKYGAFEDCFRDELYGWHLDGSDVQFKLYSNTSRLEVLGNIYENPKLLEVKS